MDLRVVLKWIQGMESGNVDCAQVAQDRFRWRAVVNTGTLNSGKFSN
jgi:hypothetical protein